MDGRTNVIKAEVEIMEKIVVFSKKMPETRGIYYRYNKNTLMIEIVKVFEEQGILYCKNFNGVKSKISELEKGKAWLFSKESIKLPKSIEIKIEDD